MIKSRGEDKALDQVLAVTTSKLLLTSSALAQILIAGKIQFIDVSLQDNNLQGRISPYTDSAGNQLLDITIY